MEMEKNKWIINKPVEDSFESSIPDHLLHHEPHQVIRRPLMSTAKSELTEEDARSMHAYSKLLEKYKAVTRQAYKYEKYIEKLENENSELGKKIEDMSWIDASIYPPSQETLGNGICLFCAMKNGRNVITDKIDNLDSIVDDIRYYKVIEPYPEEPQEVDGSVKYEVTWQYKVSSYTYHSKFDSLDEAKKFIKTSEDIVDAINVKIIEITTKTREIRQ